MKLAKLYCVSIIVNIFVLIFSADLLEEEENDKFAKTKKLPDLVS